jgi:hypothetical protein
MSHLPTPISTLSHRAGQHTRRSRSIPMVVSSAVEPLPSAGARTIKLVKDEWLTDFFEHLVAGGAHRSWERYVAHRRRKLAAIKAHNTRVRRHVEFYEQICAKLEEWNDGLRVEELAVMLGENELAVYRAARWAQRAGWLVDEGERGWRRSTRGDQNGN